MFQKAMGSLWGIAERAWTNSSAEAHAWVVVIVVVALMLITLVGFRCMAHTCECCSRRRQRSGRGLRRAVVELRTQETQTTATMAAIVVSKGNPGEEEESA